MSVGFIDDALRIAQDAPWAFDLNVSGADGPVQLALVEAWLFPPAAPGVVAYTVAGDGQSFVAGATGAVRFSQGQLASLGPARKLYMELRFRDLLGNVGRVDVRQISLSPGQGFSRPGDQALGAAYDIEFSQDLGAASVLGLVGGPMGPPRTSLELPISAELQALLGGPANVDDALSALAQPLAADVATELTTSLGGQPPTLANILTLLLTRAGLIELGRGGEWKPAL